MSDLSNTNSAEPVQYMLTTIDNPYDPFDQYDEWYVWDFMHGYHTPEYLARVCQISDELSDVDQLLAIQLAISDIIADNVSGVHRRVVRGQVAREHE